MREEGMRQLMEEAKNRQDSATTGLANKRITPSPLVIVVDGSSILLRPFHLDVTNGEQVKAAVSVSNPLRRPVPGRAVISLVPT
jgi:cytochrome c oxidase assembly protein Cox11